MRSEVLRAGEDAEAAQGEITLAGVTLVADRAGAVYWPDQGLLVVSDLHLEKGSSFARRGMLLPPYDTCATLVLLLGATTTVVAATEAPAMTESHATQAQFYTQQAADFRKKAESHRQQAKHDHGKSNSTHASMVNHCNRIADSLDAAAKDSDALAAEHRELEKSDK